MNSENKPDERKPQMPIAVASSCAICGEEIITEHPHAKVSHIRCAFNSMAAVRRAQLQAPHKFENGNFIK